MRKGRRLAIDVGSVRIGLASCDPDGILSSPLSAISRRDSASETIQEIAELVSELAVIEVLVGDPISLSGNQTGSTKDARELAIRIASAIAVPVRLVDERLTTVSAQAKLRESGKDSRTSKSLIDSASAVEILEQALNTERSTGQAPGILVADLDG
jgi:putative holliday junction resolvase